MQRAKFENRKMKIRKSAIVSRKTDAGGGKSMLNWGSSCYRKSRIHLPKRCANEGWHLVYIERVPALRNTNSW
jgi:hypothetical protein